MAWQVLREHEIACGHRVYGHEGKCAHFHGHNYLFEFSVAKSDDSISPLDGIGRVIDFSVIKELLCGWLEKEWDHKFLVWRKDPLWKALWDADPLGTVIVPFNPTAENIAAHFVEDIAPGLLLGTGASLVQLRLWETSKCSAIYTLEGKANDRTVGLGRERSEAVQRP